MFMSLLTCYEAHAVLYNRAMAVQPNSDAGPDTQPVHQDEWNYQNSGTVFDSCFSLTAMSSCDS